jgi:hypothetical protein
MTTEQFIRVTFLLGMFDISAEDAVARGRQISGRNIESLIDLSPEEAVRLIQELEAAG